MILEKQVVSLELAKRMKELGFKQSSIFYWSHKWEGSSDDDAGKDIITIGDDEHNTIPICHAYTVGELGWMLPPWLEPHGVSDNDGWLCIFKTDDGQWVCKYENRYLYHADTEVGARAKMLICLAEKKMIPTIK